MVVIEKAGDYYQVIGKDYRERFRTPAKALIAAHVVAFGEAGADHTGEVRIVVPQGWGDDVVIKASLNS